MIFARATEQVQDCQKTLTDTVTKTYDLYSDFYNTKKRLMQAGLLTHDLRD